MIRYCNNFIFEAVTDKNRKNSLQLSALGDCLDIDGIIPASCLVTTHSGHPDTIHHFRAEGSFSPLVISTPRRDLPPNWIIENS